MSLARFLGALAETGLVTVSPDLAEGPDEEVETVLLEFDRVARLNLADDAPEYLPDVALWAAALLYRACQFLVCRDVDEALIEEGLRLPCPRGYSPAVAYSVDLVLQYIPGLVRMTRQVAAGDPLLRALVELGRAWPLSSVGVRNVGDVDVSGFIEDPALSRLYVDRILARQDLSRLGDPRVDAAVREALGGYPELGGAVADRLGLRALSAIK